MPDLTIPFIVLIFIAGTAAGAFRAYRQIKAFRKDSQSSAALRKWSAMPLPPSVHEPKATAAMYIHILALLILAIIAFRTAFSPGFFNNSFGVNEATMRALVWFIQWGSLTIIAYLLGSHLTACIQTVFRSDLVTIRITENGLFYGRSFLSWNQFSHCTVEKKASLLKLYSPFSPELPSLLLKPNASENLTELGDMIYRFLPSSPSQENRAWYQKGYLLVPTMLLACLPVVIAAWLTSVFLHELSLYVIALLMVILVYLGGAVTNLFAFGSLGARK